MANSTVADLKVSRAHISGAIFFAPAGTALPTNATTALAAGYKNLGHIGADGIGPSRDVATDDVTDMNGDLLLTLQTGFSKTYSAPMLSVLNEDLANAIFGDANVTVTAADADTGKVIAITDAGLASNKGVMVIELRDNGSGRERRILPVAQVTSAEEGALVGTSVQQYTITFSAFKDDTGVYEYRYVDNGVFAA